MLEITNIIRFVTASEAEVDTGIRLEITNIIRFVTAPLIATLQIDFLPNARSAAATMFSGASPYFLSN
jgi:hypothetical protein